MFDRKHCTGTERFHHINKDDFSFWVDVRIVWRATVKRK